MQLKQVAEMVGVAHKDVAKVIEERRAELEGQGFTIAKKLIATSKLDDGLAAMIVGEFDKAKQRADEEARRRAAAAQKEHEKDRMEELARQQQAKQAELERQQEEARRRAEEENRRKAEEADRARKAAEAAAREAAAREAAEAAAAKAAADAAAAKAAAAAAAAPAAPPAAEPQPAGPVAAAPAAAPVAQAPAPPAPAAPQAPAPPRPQAPTVARPQAPLSPRPGAGSQGPMSRNNPGPQLSGSRPSPTPNSYPGAQPPRFPPGPRPTPGMSRQEQQGGYQGRGGEARPPREGGYQGRPGDSRPPREGGYQPREGGYQGRPGDSRPPREGGYQPREGGYQGRPGDSRGPGGYQGRPGGDSRGPGGYQGRPGESRGPGGYQGRPGESRGPGGYQGRPGESRGPGGYQGRPGEGRGPGGPRPGGPPGAARPGNIAEFIQKGMDSTVDSDFRKTQSTRRQPTKLVKPVTTKDKETADWESKKAKKPAVKAAPLDDVAGRKKIRPTQIFQVDPLFERRAKLKRKSPGHQSGPGQQQNPAIQEPRTISIHGDFTVGEFADKIGVPAAEVIKRLFLMKHMVTINQLLDPDLAEELAIEMNVEINVVRESDAIDIDEYLSEDDEAANMEPRPPVVTIMGHVDHGKTSLLDRIRKADVASQEFGGITQHIGAYLVVTPKGKIAFLDTPGHAAFTEMRSRGANITDVVLLVVAANDGVMPQTIEAINHAKAAKVPIMVAINKVDAEGANPQRVMQDLMTHELVAEQFGGDVIMLPVSAKTGQGMDQLLEYVALQTEVMELKANPNRAAEGTIVESHVDPQRGAVATVLIERGTLNIGDAFVCGTEYGRVRAMRDDRDHHIEKAGPSVPVEILGLNGSPEAGEKFIVVPTESEAREIAERRARRRRLRSAVAKEHISLDNLRDRMTEGDVTTLNLILKGDVQGSVQAIATALFKIKSDKVVVRILHSAVGAVSRSDVQLADASEAIILGFNVSVEPSSRQLAEELGVDIRSYNVIYALLEDIEKAMMGLLEPEFKEKEEGRAEVKEIFKVSKIGAIAGCLVVEGAVNIAHKARLSRNGSIIWNGKIKSLRRVKDEAKEVLAGVECGIRLENFNDVKAGDFIETYSMVEQAISLMNEVPAPAKN